VCGGIQESEALLLIPPGGFNVSVDGALLDVWPYFPGTKVGQIFLYPFYYLPYLMALIVSR
jgi:hypothetical protein